MNKVVVIGGSAGSISVVKALLSNLPSKIPYSIIIVVHQKEECHMSMAKTLDSICKYPVVDPEDGVDILPGYIYVAPSMYHMQVEPNQTISYAIDERIKFSRPSLDVLFQTAAWTYKDNLLAIVLSGLSSDGVAGSKTVVDYKGTVVVQDSEEAEASIMPFSVLEALSLKRSFTTEQLIQLLKNWGV